MKRITMSLLLGLMPLLVGCPGPLEGHKDPAPPIPDPNQPSLGFQFYGRKEVTAGEWRVDWGIDRAPAVNAPTRTRFQGPGTLVDPNMVPVIPGQEYPGSGGYYLPPADVPAEGAVVKVGCEVLSPFTSRWERSPDYEIKVVKRTAPMDFCFGVNTPCDQTEGTVKAGQEFGFGFQIRPYPATCPTPIPVLIGPADFMEEIGTLLTRPVADGTWGCVYTAPATVLAPMDVRVRIGAFDPWVQQDREVYFTIHVQP